MYGTKKRIVAFVVAVSCMLTMVLGTGTVSLAQDAQAVESFDSSQAEEMIFSQLYSVSVTATQSALFTFETPGSNVNYQLKALLSAGTSLEFTIYDSAQNEVLQQSLSNNGYTHFALPKSSTYYMLVTGTAEAVGRIVLTKITDDFGDSGQTASAMEYNKEYAVTTDIANDPDYLYFAVDGTDATYTLCIEPTAGYTGTYELWNMYGQRIDSYSGVTGRDGMVLFDMQLAPYQTYFLRFCSTEVDRQVVVSVKRTIRRYRVTYHLNGGTNSSKNLTTYVATQNWKLQNPKRKGYLFDGWYLTANYRNRVYNMSGATKRNIDLYAKWNPVRISRVASVKLKKSSTKLKVSFKKVSGAKRYQVQISTNAKFKKAKTYTAKKTSMVSHKLKRTKYYVRVRAYATDSTGARVYGAYSKAKKISMKAVSKKSSSKKSSSKKSTSKKSTSKKSSSKKSSSKKSTSKKSTSKKTSSKKTSSKKTSSKKTSAKK